jgi:hypothetical protein
MKKVALSLAGILAAAAFAPEASAVPVFARQTGMACNACHFQHFPLLNGFGRAFKASGFTLMGAQTKVEGEHLSIPSTLNMGVLATAYYQTQSGNPVVGGLPGVGGVGNWGVPGSGGELSLFYGGRINDFSGFLSELGAAGAAATGAAKLPILFEVGDSRIGLVAYTGGQGAAYSFENLNTGAAGVHKLMGNTGPANQHVNATSAAQWLGTKTNATGLSLVAVNPNLGFVNIGKWEAAPAGTAVATTLPLTYARIAATLDLGGWDTGFGIQNFSGSSVAGLGGAAYKATVFDGQMQGQVGGMPLGLYASYGTAPASGATINTFNAGTLNTASSFNIAGELGVIPGKATVQAAYRNAKTGGGLKDNAFMVAATYELSMNMEVSLHYTTQSGSAWNGAGLVGKNATTLLLETLF